MIRQHDSLLVQYVSNFLVPFIQLFGFYVLFHGHYSPGGGFQAGVLIGASFILKLLVLGTEERKAYKISRELFFAALGLLIYAGIGLAAFFYDASFLDYGSLDFFSSEVAQRRYFGIYFIEIGVTLTVAMTLVIIFNVLALSNEKN